MHKKILSIMSILISCLIVFFTIFFFLEKKETFSEGENRYLASVPEFTFKNLTSGKYMEQIQNYFSDHFPYRDDFMKIRAFAYKLTFQKVINGVYLGKDGYLLEEFKKPNNQEKIIKRLLYFESLLTDQNVYFLLAPTSTSIYSEKLPFLAKNESQSKVIEAYYSALPFIEIDVTPTLLKQKENYEMYYKLDHHWTTYGAYFAYLLFCEKAGITPHLLSEFAVYVASNQFYGTYYSKVNDYSLQPDTITRFDLKNLEYEVTYVDTGVTTKTFYEDSYLEKKDKYASFLDNNHPLIVIENKNSDNTDEIVVIKDSYANCFVPFLASHYKKVHVFDPRYYNDSISSYIKENQIANVLFLYNVGTLDNDLGIISIR